MPLVETPVACAWRTCCSARVSSLYRLGPVSIDAFKGLFLRGRPLLALRLVPFALGFTERDPTGDDVIGPSKANFLDLSPVSDMYLLTAAEYAGAMCASPLSWNHSDIESSGVFGSASVTTCNLMERSSSSSLSVVLGGTTTSLEAFVDALAASSTWTSPFGWACQFAEVAALAACGSLVVVSTRPVSKSVMVLDETSWWIRMLSSAADGCDDDDDDGK